MGVARLTARLAVLSSLGVALALLGAGAAQAGTPRVTRFHHGIAGHFNPLEITAGPDGKLWFTEDRGLADEGDIGRISPSGSETNFDLQPLPYANAIAAGPDGNLWFPANTGSLGRITPTGGVTEYSSGLTDTPDSGIAAGPDGNLWFLEQGNSGHKIGKISPAGSITEYLTPTITGIPARIAAGPDGNLWFTEFGSKRIGRITTSGAVTEFSSGITAGAEPRGITTGPDGNLWFVEFRGFQHPSRIGRITPSGSVREFSHGIHHPAYAIAAGPDGNLWFTEQRLHNPPSHVGRITPSGRVKEFRIASHNTGPNGIATGPDGKLWIAEEHGIARMTTGRPRPAYRNAAKIRIPASASGPANPYPSKIHVSGLGHGRITKVKVRLTGIYDNPSGDFKALLVGPHGQKALIYFDAGGGAVPEQDVTLTLSDGARRRLPPGAPIVSGVYKPTGYGASAAAPFDAPAPAGPYTTRLSVFNGHRANGNWKLYVENLAGLGNGTIFGGWGLDIKTRHGGH